MAEKAIIPLKPNNSQYTDGQWQAIYDSGQNILVSASAGSGKTTVLVERVIEKIKAGTNIDELLIVTYTEAAAKEMKQRIQSAVQKAINEEVDGAQKNHFIHQLSLIPTASISTLHAFCLQVIRRYYYLIHLDPVFRLLTDETEMILLKEDVWEELREKLYGKDQTAFYQLTENFSNDRNDNGLTELIFSLYEFARSNPNLQEWLDSLGNAYQVEGNLANSELYQKVLRPQLLEQLTKVKTDGEEMLRLAEGEPDLAKAYELSANELTSIRELLQRIEENDLDTAYQVLNTMVFERFSGAKRGADEAVKEVSQQIKMLRDRNKKILTDLKRGFFAIAPTEMVEIMEQAGKVVSEMTSVGKAFNQAYSERKAERNVVDFNDLEHFTLQILANYENGEWTPTEASNHFRLKFSEVLVDEYQDINQLQENILFWLRRPAVEEGNLFMVGDVKQSIYSFRLADPMLFIDKYNLFAKGEAGRRIILAENFRSRSNVLDFTNLIFLQLMNERVGQMDYDDAAHLINGFKNFPESTQFDTEILIYESGKEAPYEEEVADVDDAFSIDDKTEGELRLVGQKIQELIQSEFPIYDKKQQVSRPIRYQDIVLLTPTKKNNLVLLDIFKEMNIPLHVNDTQNYFQATEIRIMIALLHVIDNPYQDIPLAAVLRSPIVGLKENQLVFLRRQNQSGTFYDALQSYLYGEAVTNDFPGLRGKLLLFENRLLGWRELARQKQLVTLIWNIYQETGFLDYVGGMSAGKQRQANLHALYERATSYEEMSFKGLFQFVRFIEKMQEKNKDLAEPTALSGEQDAVRVMTIHASKGLEFPVVFVLDLTRRFNLSDLRQKYIFDAHLGAGIQYVDTEARTYFPTLPLLAIKEEKKKKLLSEEMRKLYVALTRAEEKLFLVGSYKDQETAWKEWSSSAQEEEVVLSEEARLNSQHLMKWIGLSLMRHPDTQQFQQEYDTAKIGVLENHPAHFKISFTDNQQLLANQSFLQPIQEIQPSQATLPFKEEQEVVQRAIQLLEFEYAFETATRTTSYQSVSEIKRVFEDPDNSELLTLDLSTERPTVQNRFVEEHLAKPSFMETVGEPKATEIGTATHLIMQLVPLDQRPTQGSITELIAHLVEEQVILPAVAAKIQVDSLLAFFETELGEKLLANHQTVTREQPFSILMNAQKIFRDYPSQKEDEILIHGIIDGYLETEDELILYDFKTNHVNKQKLDTEIQRIKQEYQGQMNLYKQALEQVKNRKVTKSVIALLSVPQNIKM